MLPVFLSRAALHNTFDLWPTCSQHFTEGIMSSSILQIYPSTPEVPCSVTHLDRVSLCPNAPPSAQSWLSWQGGEGPSIFDSLESEGKKSPQNWLTE